MKKILIKLSIVTFALIMTMILLEYLYDFSLQNNYYLKYSSIQKRKINAENLFIGSCVPNTSISPELLENNTYNLGVYHSNYIENYLALYLYLKNNKSPKRIFVYTSPECFDERFNHLNSFRMLPHLNDKTVNNTIKKYDYQTYQRSKIPFLKYSFENLNITYDMITGLKHYIKKDKQILYSNGFIELKNFTLKRSYPKNYKFKWYKKNEIYLNKIIQLSKSKKTEVILYESPVFELFATEQPNRNEFILKIKKLALKNRIKFIQFGNQYFNKNKVNFINTVNLSKKGVLEFNKELKKYLCPV